MASTRVRQHHKCQRIASAIHCVQNEFYSRFATRIGRLKPAILILATLSTLLGAALFAAAYYQPTREARKLVNDWMNDLRTGGDGIAYWHPGVRRLQFFSVRNWKILQLNFTPPRPGGSLAKIGNVLMRVESSNRAGIPVTLDYDLTIIQETNRPRWVIFSLSDRYGNR